MWVVGQVGLIITDHTKGQSSSKEADAMYLTGKKAGSSIKNSFRRPKPSIRATNSPN